MYDLILSALLTISTPGASPFSVVELPECGTEPTRPTCALSPPARWSRAYGAFVRQETAEEGRARYALIAQALDNVVERSTDRSSSAALWPWHRRELAAALLTIANHESGFRRDIHAGVGPRSLGDCRRVAGRPSLCRSFCLVQVNTGGPDVARAGFRGRDLVGLDVDATERCFTAGARVLAAARYRCARESAEAWFTPAISLYGSGRTCADRGAWVADRAATYGRIAL